MSLKRSSSFVVTLASGACHCRHRGCPGGASGSAIAPHRRRARHRRHDCRRRRQRRAGRLRLRPGRRRPAARRRPAGQEARQHARRADLEHRLPGHERRGVAEAGTPRQRTGRDAGRRRRGDHARHRHDRGNGVLPEPRRQVQEAGRADGVDAPVDGALGRRPAELLQRRGRGGEQGGGWTRRARRRSTTGSMARRR